MRRPTLSRAVEPVNAPVELADFKAHARIDGSFEDTVLQNALDAAIDNFDGADGSLGQALITQTWKQTQYRPSGEIRVHLTVPPFQSLSSIEYYDADHALQTATLSEFMVVQDGDFHFVRPKPGNAWPAMADRPDALSLTYVAGFGDAAENVPRRIKQAIRMLAAHWANEREAVTVAQFMRDVPRGVDALVEPYRVYWVLS